MWGRVDCAYERGYNDALGNIQRKFRHSRSEAGLQQLPSKRSITPMVREAQAMLREVH